MDRRPRSRGGPRKGTVMATTTATATTTTDPAGGGAGCSVPAALPASSSTQPRSTRRRHSKPNLGDGGRAPSWRRFARHYLLMVVAMYAGMLVLDPVYAAVATRAGCVDPWTRLPVTSALMMSVNMTVPMVLLMLRHHHGVLAIV